MLLRCLNLHSSRRTWMTEWQLQMAGQIEWPWNSFDFQENLYLSDRGHNGHNTYMYCIFVIGLGWVWTVVEGRKGGWIKLLIFKYCQISLVHATTSFVSECLLFMTSFSTIKLAPFFNFRCRSTRWLNQRFKRVSRWMIGAVSDDGKATVGGTSLCRKTNEDPLRRSAIFSSEPPFFYPLVRPCKPFPFR